MNVSANIVSFSLLHCSAITVGFEQTDIFVDENAFEASFNIAVLQGAAERRFVVGVRTQERTATGLLV